MVLTQYHVWNNTVLTILPLIRGISARTVQVLIWCTCGPLSAHLAHHLPVPVWIVDVGPVGVVPVTALDPVVGGAGVGPLDGAPQRGGAPQVQHLLAAQPVPDV